MSLAIYPRHSLCSESDKHYNLFCFKIMTVSKMDRPIGCKPTASTPTPTPTTAAPIVTAPTPTHKKLRTSKHKMHVTKN